MPEGETTLPREGALAIVRNRRGIVTSVKPSGSPREERIHLVTVEYTDADGVVEDQIIWEREPGARIVEPNVLPQIDSKDPMPAADFDALVRATRWTALTPFIDPDQDGPLERLPVAAPFHGAIQVEDFQLVPLVKALRMPRISLLLADDVGLGKTIEAGLVLSELLLRRRVRRVLIICPASLSSQWREEMNEKFSTSFDLVDRAQTHKLRRELGMDANPWRTFSRIITSYYYLKQPDILEQFLAASKPAKDSPHLPWDLLIVDEAHNLVPAAYGEDSELAKMLSQLAPVFENKLFLTATPHNGHTRSFTGLLEKLDPVRFSQTSEISAAEKGRIEDVVVRRLKREINAATKPPRFCDRSLEALPLDLGVQERALAKAYQAFRGKVQELVRELRRNEQIAGSFAVEVLGKRLLSCPVALADSWYRYQEGLAEAERAEAEEVRAAERSVREDTGDDQEAESRVAHAARTVGAWLKPFKEKLKAESAKLEEALHALGLKKPSEGESVIQIDPKQDARFDALVAWIEKKLREKKGWRSDDRLVIFTEYKTTLDYLQRRLLDRYKDDAAIRVLYGSMDLNERDEIKAAFNDPNDPVRVLVATDTASEGLNLQETARYLLHYDIPWNPARLEQRNGRLDRHGQARDVVIHHFATDDDADLDFLAYVLHKVNQIRDDLGSMEEVFDTAIQSCLIDGGDHKRIRAELDLKAGAARDRAAFPRDKSIRAAAKDGQDEMQRLAALREELDLDPDTLRETLDVALGVGVGRPRLEAPNGDGLYRLRQPIPPSWLALLDDHLRLRTREHAGALPALVFDPHRFVREVSGRPVFRPLKGSALLHLGHPLYHRALATFAKARFPGVEHEATRWTVRRGPVPKGADALLLVTVEELAVNDLREMFHHWVRTVVFPVRKGDLGSSLPHEPAIRHRCSGEVALKDVSTAKELWEDLEPEVREQLREMAKDLTKRLNSALASELKEALDREQERFRSRHGEVSKLMEQQSIQRLEKEIAALQVEQAQGQLFDNERFLDGLAASQREKEEELKRRNEHYEELRELLNQERDRIVKHLIPRRYALRAEARVFPVAVEIRLPEGST